MKKCVQILKDGTMDELIIKNKKLNNISKFLTKSAKSQGNNSIQKLYTWKYENKLILCYSWYDGEAGFENKHDLPTGGKSDFLEEDSSVKILFGDIFLILTDNLNIFDFIVSDYAEFYNIAFGGFDDCNTDTDENDINTEEEDEDYIHDDILSEDEFIINNKEHNNDNKDELKCDNSVY